MTDEARHMLLDAIQREIRQVEFQRARVRRGGDEELRLWWRQHDLLDRWYTLWRTGDLRLDDVSTPS